MVQQVGSMALTQLGEDVQLFRDTVRRFATEQIAPLVRGMDETQQMDAGLIQKLFGLGLMGIEVPEEYGGAGGTFFQAILAVEAISAVDPSVGVLVDVQNTLCINALPRGAKLILNFQHSFECYTRFNILFVNDKLALILFSEQMCQ